MADPVKLCRDCRYLEGARCLKSPMPPDYVNGVARGFYSAQTEREGSSVVSCGASARFFEPRTEPRTRFNIEPKPLAGGYAEDIF